MALARGLRTMQVPERQIGPVQELENRIHQAPVQVAFRKIHLVQD